MPRPQPVPSEVLNRLLEKSGADRFELPPLVTQQNEAPGLLDKLMKWIQSLFPNTGPAAPGAWLGILLKGLAYTGAILIVVAIASMIYTAMKRAKQKAEDAKFGLRRGQSELPPKEQLVAMLEDALRAGRTAEAARLRWKLYLVRKALPGSITPGETETFGRFYPLMFGMTAGEAALREFNDLDLSLRSREAGGTSR